MRAWIYIVVKIPRLGDFFQRAMSKYQRAIKAIVISAWCHPCQHLICIQICVSNRGQIKKNICLGIFYLCYPLCFFYDDGVKRKRKWEECLDFCVFARFYPYCFLQQMCLPRGIHARRIRNIRRVVPGII